MIGGELSSCFACTKPIQFRAAETRLLVCHSCGSVNFRKPEWKESNLIHCAAIPPDRTSRMRRPQAVCSGVPTALSPKRHVRLVDTAF